MTHLGSCPLRSSPLQSRQLHRQHPPCRSSPTVTRCLKPLSPSRHSTWAARPSYRHQHSSGSQTQHSIHPPALSNSKRKHGHCEVCLNCLHPTLVAKPESELTQGLAGSSVRSICFLQKRTSTKASSSADGPADPKEMPNLVMRMLAAICYMVPWLDIIGMGREVWRRLINLVILLWIPGMLPAHVFTASF